MKLFQKSWLILFLALLLTGCASLQQKWDEATEDEKTRIMISQFQGTLKSSFILAEAFVKVNPQYNEVWKTKVLPMFDFVNKILNDFIQRGKAGEKFTVLQVTSVIAWRIQEIEFILKLWGVKI